MSSQAVDRHGAADYLNLSVGQVNYRIKNNTFPPPDEVGSVNSEDTDWWTLPTLDKYQRAQARKRKRNSKSS